MDIKPREIKTWKYWVHVVLIAVIVNYVLVYFFNDILTLNINTVLALVGLIAVADVISHTILRLD